MESNNLKLMKVRDFGDVLNASFQFLKNEWKTLGQLLLYYFVPFLVLFSALQSYSQVKLLGFMTNVNPENAMEMYTSIFKSPLIITTYLSQLFILTMLAGILYSYFQVYKEKGQGQVTVADIAHLLFPNSIKALGITIVVSLVSLIGFVLCFLPGIFLANSLSLAMVAFILEKKGLNDALNRSWNLVKTQWWNTLLINIIGIIIVSIIGYILSFPLTLFTITKSVLAASDTGLEFNVPTWYMIVQGIVSMISTTLYIIPYTFVAFQYFNLVERNERPSLLEKIDQLEKNED